MRKDYDYYCTYCGENNCAETVLFDMDMLLTQDPNKHMNFLPLRMTLNGLEKLAQPMEDETLDADGFRHCSMTFSELTEALSFTYSAEKSMNREYLRELSLDEVRSFINEGEKESYPVLQGIMDKLVSQNKENRDKNIDAEVLKSELSLIANLFSQEDRTYSFRIKLKTDWDDQNQKLVTGYYLNQNILSDNARVCRRCGHRLFKGAGTAEHRVVTFIGSTGSGKTSTILGLTHYALYGLIPIGDSDEVKVWQAHGNGQRSRVAPKLLNEDVNLRTDLDWYTYGVAPKKTEYKKREDAYHATMKFFNREAGKQIILSLIDLPGELFKNGELKDTILSNEFRAALSSTAFVTCFEEEKATLKDITDLMNYFEEMQTKCQEYRKDKYFIPNMILFAKSDASIGVRAAKRSGRDIYMLQDEADQMEDNDCYQIITKNFRLQLKKGYYAVMRCGAFGHRVPLTDDIVESEKNGPKVAIKNTDSDESLGSPTIKDRVLKYVKQDETALEQMRPTPNHIDLLMQWILKVSGCIACEAEYTVPNPDCNYTLSNYYVDQLQFRPQNPNDINEAMARKLLFVNPGCWDEELVRSVKRDAELDQSRIFSLLPAWLRGLFIQTQEEHIEYKMKKMRSEPEANANEDIGGNS